MDVRNRSKGSEIRLVARSKMFRLWFQAPVSGGPKHSHSRPLVVEGIIFSRFFSMQVINKHLQVPLLNHSIKVFCFGSSCTKSMPLGNVPQTLGTFVKSCGISMVSGWGETRLAIEIWGKSRSSVKVTFRNHFPKKQHAIPKTHWRNLKAKKQWIGLNWTDKSTKETWQLFEKKLNFVHSASAPLPLAVEHFQCLKREPGRKFGCIHRRPPALPPNACALNNATMKCRNSWKVEKSRRIVASYVF